MEANKALAAAAAVLLIPILLALVLVKPPVVALVVFRAAARLSRGRARQAWRARVGGIARRGIAAPDIALVLALIFVAVRVALLLALAPAALFSFKGDARWVLADQSRDRPVLLRRPNRVLGIGVARVLHAGGDACGRYAAVDAGSQAPSHLIHHLEH